MDLDAEQLRERLHYDPETGVFTWKTSRFARYVGKPAGIAGRHGYNRIMIDRQTYQAHRLAWLHVYGHWPKGVIDHINRVRDDNRISNLREISLSFNQHNSTKSRGGRSGLIGAIWDEAKQRFFSRIKVNGKHHYLGSFETAQEAHLAYMAAKRKLHPGFVEPAIENNFESTL